METENEVKQQSELDQAAYRKRCTHRRVGGLVRELDKAQTIVFDGSKECKNKSCIGSNAAKKYVRKNNLVAYKEVA